MDADADGIVHATGHALTAVGGFAFGGRDLGRAAEVFDRVTCRLVGRARAPSLP